MSKTTLAFERALKFRTSLSFEQFKKSGAVPKDSSAQEYVKYELEVKGGAREVEGEEETKRERES